MKFSTSLALILIISIGVTIGNLTSSLITTTTVAYFANKALKEETARLDKQRKEANLRAYLQSQKDQKEAAIKNEQNRVENERRRKDEEAKAAVRNKLRSTCEFWQREYNKNRKEYDRANMDMACRAANNAP
ncbi:MAG: hypothetical protein ACI4NJ_12030 [Cellvibrio sp.]